jgi:hypothetical protein
MIDFTEWQARNFREVRGVMCGARRCVKFYRRHEKFSFEPSVSLNATQGRGSNVGPANK